MKSLLTTFKIIILIISLSIHLIAQPFDPPLPEPGTATIDGSANEWDLTLPSPNETDWFAYMYEGFNNNGKDRVYSNLFLRYDCDNNVMYVLVYQAIYDGNPVPILVDGDHWIAIPNINTKVVEDEDNNDGTPPDFAFIGVNYDGDPNHARGWEASFPLAEGATTILAHANVYVGGIQTSGTGGSTSLNVDCSALPVEMTSFSVSVNNSLAELQWETATEVNNYGFEVQRSSDSKNWLKVGFLNGHGNSNSPKTYFFTDESITLTGKYFYRLKQIDIDGQFEYSDIVEIDFSSTLDFKLNQNYPNPFNPTTTISYSIPEQTHTKLTIYNIFGEEITQLVNDVKEAGTYSIKFNGENLASGLYIYTLETDKFTSTKKLLLLK